MCHKSFVKGMPETYQVHVAKYQIKWVSDLLSYGYNSFEVLVKYSPKV